MNAIVFITGACVLIIEVLAIRILSPYFGNTLYTVSSVISVVLAALSVGYFIGGKLADKRPSKPVFYGIISAGGFAVLGLYLLSIFILPFLAYTLPIVSGPLIASMFLFFLPSFLLGMLSPFAIKLQHIAYPEKGPGSIAGEIFFWSTLGSIAGSIGAGFVLIPRIGINNILLIVGTLLCALGILPLLKINPKTVIFRIYFKPFAILIIGSILIAIFFSSFKPDEIIYERDGIYEKLVILDGDYIGRPTRFFRQDRSASGAMFLDTGDLVYDYSKYFVIYQILNPDVKRALVIGGGIYSITKSFLKEFPAAAIVAVEIEPSLFELAKKYFNAEDDPRFQNYIGDGRRFLHDTEQNYDLIFGDAYHSLFSIPVHLATEEFFKLVRSKLNADGLFIANFIGSLARSRPALTLSEFKTFRDVFPNSYFFATQSPKLTRSQNFILVGVNGDKKIDFQSNIFNNNNNEIIRALGAKVVDLKRFNFDMYDKLTDNYAPVDYMTTKLLNNYNQSDFRPSGEEMMAIIEQQLTYGLRSTNTDGLKKTGDFIFTEMKTLAHNVIEQNQIYKFENDGESNFRNIVAQFWPEKPKRIILGTHYDSKAGIPGANDSASGVAVLIELSRYLATSDKKPAVGVDIVFFDGEEIAEENWHKYGKWEPLGSTYFAKNLITLYPEILPQGALILDMICDKNLNLVKEITSFGNATKDAEAFWKIGKKISPKAFNSGGTQEILDDHTPLNASGIPSVLIIDFDYPHWHTINDTIDKCSSKSLEVISEAVIEYIFAK